MKISYSSSNRNYLLFTSYFALRDSVPHRHTGYNVMFVAAKLFAINLISMCPCIASKIQI